MVLIAHVRSCTLRSDEYKEIHQSIFWIHWIHQWFMPQLF